MALKLEQDLVGPKPTVVALAGAFGSGKTTLLLALLEAVVTREMNPHEIAVILNEEGGISECTPGHDIAREILANGCATCGDEREVPNAIEVLRQQKAGLGHELKLVFYEGFGSVSGAETARTFRNAGYPLHTIGILNGENHEAMLADYSHLLASHVAEATLAIVVTKLRRSRVPAPITDFIAKQWVGKVNVAVIPSKIGAPVIPDDFVARLLARPFTIAACGHGCGAGCTHDHHHSHHHHHHGHVDVSEHREVHGAFPYAFRLKLGVTAEQVQAYFDDLVRQGLARAKGATETESFNVTFYGRWQVKPVSCSDNPQTLIVYFGRGAVVSPKELYERLVDSPIGNKEVGEEWHGYEMQRHSDLPVAKLIERNQQLRAEVAELRPYVTSDGVLVTHPTSLQNLKEGARREGVKSSCMAPAITTCLEYWLQAVPLLQEPTLTTPSREKAWCELGVSIAWWATERYEEPLPAELLKQVREAKPAVLIAHGLLSLDSLRQNLWWRFWQVKEFERALTFSGDFMKEEQELIERATAHLEELKAQPITIV